MGSEYVYTVEPQKINSLLVVVNDSSPIQQIISELKIPTEGTEGLRKILIRFDRFVYNQRIYSTCNPDIIVEKDIVDAWKLICDIDRGKMPNDLNSVIHLLAYFVCKLDIAALLYRDVSDFTVIPTLPAVFYKLDNVKQIVNLNNVKLILPRIIKSDDILRDIAKHLCSDQQALMELITAMGEQFPNAIYGFDILSATEKLSSNDFDYQRIFSQFYLAYFEHIIVFGGY